MTLSHLTTPALRPLLVLITTWVSLGVAGMLTRRGSRLVARVLFPAGALVCLAVWLSYSARSVADKILAIVPPIAAFVAAGFEHSVANMFFIPMGLVLKGRDGVTSAVSTSSLTIVGFLKNLTASTLGNIVGGALLVGIVYWFVYLRPRANDT